MNADRVNPAPHYVPLNAARDLFPGRPSAATLRRWILRGHQSIRLRAKRSGRRWYTTATWAAEFTEQQTRAATNGQPLHTAKDTRDARRAAEDYLTAIGLWK